MHHKILELYSGIGGMHCAWNEAGLMGEIAAAIDINTVANEVYSYNFPGTKLLNRDIKSVSLEEIKKLNVDTILMSPPCQPFTRNGKHLDENDPRTNSFLYLMNILDKLENINYILMENVKGFDCSTVRNIFIEKLKSCDYIFQEFLLCPMSVGVPNSRLRYYCIATRNKNWNYRRKDDIVTSLPNSYSKPFCLDNVMEKEVPQDYLIPEKVLRKANLFDICYKNSERSCCFTKSYSHYVEGTGSVYTEANKDKVDNIIKSAKCYDVGSSEFVKTVKELQLRYFTPQEILNIMMFPKSYSFPDTITRKQCYRLLGNSVNVKVISELLKILFD